MNAGLTVIRTGPQALFQDSGRPGHAADGVGQSGSADRTSYRQANLLVGNDPGAVAIECTLAGLIVRAERDLVVALSGAPAPAEVDGTPVKHATMLSMTAGQTLRLRTPKTGLRTYLAVAGGFQVPLVLGSASTYTLSRLGPAPLARGDVLQVGDAGAAVADPAPPIPVTVLDEQTPALRVLLGPRDDWFVNPQSLAEGHWLVSPHSNRVGARLDRPEPGADGSATPGLQRRISREIPSEGIALGSIQVPPSGQPVLFLADHPLTGGYPVVGVVADDDIDRAAQLRPGQQVRFVLVD